MQIYTKCTGFTKLSGEVPKDPGDGQGVVGGSVKRSRDGQGVVGGSAKRSRGWTGNCRGGKVAGKIVGKLMGNSRKSYREEKNARDWTHRNMLYTLLREIMVTILLRATEVGHKKSNFQHVQPG